MGQAVQEMKTTGHPLLPIARLLQAAVDERVFPGCVCYLAHGDRLLFGEAFGGLSFQPLGEEEESAVRAVNTSTVYDVDSLTSSLVTTTLLMKAFSEKRFRFEERLSRYIHGFGVFGKSPIRIIDLMLQQSGLPVTEPLYQQLDSIQKDTPFGTPVGRGVAQHLYTLINRIHLRVQPGAQQQYSEVGTLVLGEFLENLWANRIDRLAEKFIFAPLQIRNSGFIDHGLVRQGKLALSTENIAPSEECPWRKRVLRGEVRDENTWAIGGASGEAGLFATAEDITVLVQSLMAAYNGNRSFLDPSTVRIFFRGEFEDAGSWQPGWAEARAAFGAEPPIHFSQSLGAVSPTGCGVWIDPEHSLSLVFLSNRTMPHRSNRKIGQFWPKLFKEVWSILGR